MKYLALLLALAMSAMAQDGPRGRAIKADQVLLDPEVSYEIITTNLLQGAVEDLDTQLHALGDALSDGLGLVLPGTNIVGATYNEGDLVWTIDDVTDGYMQGTNIVTSMGGFEIPGVLTDGTWDLDITQHFNNYSTGTVTPGLDGVAQAAAASLTNALANLQFGGAATFFWANPTATVTVTPTQTNSFVNIQNIYSSVTDPTAYYNRTGVFAEPGMTNNDVFIRVSDANSQRRGALIFPRAGVYMVSGSFGVNAGTYANNPFVMYLRHIRNPGGSPYDVASSHQALSLGGVATGSSTSTYVVNAPGEGIFFSYIPTNLNLMGWEWLSITVTYLAVLPSNN